MVISRYITILDSDLVSKLTTPAIPGIHLLGMKDVLENVGIVRLIDEDKLVLQLR